MSDNVKRITDLEQASSLTDKDVFLLSKNGSSKKILADQIATFVNSKVQPKFTTLLTSISSVNSSLNTYKTETNTTITSNYATLNGNILTVLGNMELSVNNILTGIYILDNKIKQTSTDGIRKDLDDYKTTTNDRLDNIENTLNVNSNNISLLLTNVLTLLTSATTFYNNDLYISSQFGPAYLSAKTYVDNSSSTLSNDLTGMFTQDISTVKTQLTNTISSVSAELNNVIDTANDKNIALIQDLSTRLYGKYSTEVLEETSDELTKYSTVYISGDIDQLSILQDEMYSQIIENSYIIQQISTYNVLRNVFDYASILSIDANSASSLYFAISSYEVEGINDEKLTYSPMAITNVSVFINGNYVQQTTLYKLGLILKNRYIVDDTNAIIEFENTSETPITCNISCAAKIFYVLDNIVD